MSGRDRDRASDVANSIEAVGGTAHVELADLADPSSAKSLVERTVDRFGRLDVLINAAGINIRRAAVDMTMDEWNSLLTVNLTATFALCQAVARVMIGQGTGKIINVTSLTAVIGIPNLSGYSATRGGGVNQFTKALAVELAPHGIHVNAIAPGRMVTPMTADVLGTEQGTSRQRSLIPADRLGQPEDLVGAAIFLASSASDYVIGQTIVVDGGWLACGGNPAR